MEFTSEHWNSAKGGNSTNLNVYRNKTNDVFIMKTANDKDTAPLLHLSSLAY